MDRVYALSNNVYGSNFLMHQQHHLINSPPIIHYPNRNPNCLPISISNPYRPAMGTHGTQPGQPSRFRNPAFGPLRRLIVDVRQTFDKINQKYYIARKKKEELEAANKKENKPTDSSSNDDQGYYTIKTGEMLCNRYRVESFIDQGVFGKVVKALDTVNMEYVAIKIIKKQERFSKQARIEAKILELIRHQKGYDSKKFIVQSKGHFIWENHVCLVFELLSHNMIGLLERTEHYAVSLKLARKFAVQLCYALHFLSEMKIIHCDLKLENILLRDEIDSFIRVVDFGSSCRVGQVLYQHVQTRYYRSPEVILGIPYDQAIDMWSLGCVLIELCTGEPLFAGEDECDQINKIVEIMGMPPQHMLNQGRKTKRFFTRVPPYGLWVLRKRERGVEYKMPGKRKITETFDRMHGEPGSPRREELGFTGVTFSKFLDLIFRMLSFDPKKRITPHEALLHDFFKGFQWSETHKPVGRKSRARKRT